MKTNTRGDSGLSDSGLRKSQMSFLRSHQDAIDKFEQKKIITCGSGLKNSLVKVDKNEIQRRNHWAGFCGKRYTVSPKEARLRSCHVLRYK